MIRINIHEAKTHFSRYLASVQAGETILVCKHNIPIAEIRPIEQPKPQRRLDLAKGKGSVPDSFFEPLPNDLLDLFEGKGP